MRIRHSLLTSLASLAVAVTGANMAFGQINVFWNGGDGNFTDDNWIDGDGISVIPFGTDNIFINSGAVTIDTDLFATEGAFGQLSIGDATLTVTTGGNAEFGNVLLGEPAEASATLIMEGNAVFSGQSFRWASAVGSTGDVIIRDTATFRTTNTQDIIGFSSAFGAGTWTTVGSSVDLRSDDDIWIGDDDVWIANITDPDTYSTAFADDAFGFVGNGAVQVNLSGFTQQLGQRWRLIESHGETTQGPIANGALPATFTVTGAEPGIGLNILSEEVSDTLGFLDVEVLNVLNLRVDTTTGEAILENPVAGGEPLDVDGYTISSESGSLDADAFGGLADDGEAGWFPGLPPSQGSNRISEANFDGSTTFTAGAAAGDFDKNGQVDGDDFLIWQANFKMEGTSNTGDATGDGFVDGDDFLIWQAEFGQPVGGDSFALGAIFDTSGTQDLAIEFTTTNGLTLGGTIQYVGGGGGGSGVPEPTAALMLFLAATGVIVKRVR